MIARGVEGADRPRVYYAMGHPLFALNPGRFEGKLVEAAGGSYVNRSITREGKPGVTITPEEFIALDPQVPLHVGLPLVHGGGHDAVLQRARPRRAGGA